MEEERGRGREKRGESGANSKGSGERRANSAEGGAKSKPPGFRVRPGMTAVEPSFRRFSGRVGGLPASALCIGMMPGWSGSSRGMGAGEVLVRAHCILTTYTNTSKKCDAPATMPIAHSFHARIRPSEKHYALNTCSPLSSHSPTVPSARVSYSPRDIPCLSSTRSVGASGCPGGPVCTLPHWSRRSEASF